MDGFISAENLAQQSGQHPSSALQRPHFGVPAGFGARGRGKHGVRGRPQALGVRRVPTEHGAPRSACPVSGPLARVRSPVGPLVGLLTREGGPALSWGHRAPACLAACVSHGVAGEELFPEGEWGAAEGTVPARRDRSAPSSELDPAPWREGSEPETRGPRYDQTRSARTRGTALGLTAANHPEASCRHAPLLLARDRAIETELHVNRGRLAGTAIRPLRLLRAPRAPREVLTLPD
ncbi:hypothetical protein IscW_ISCW000578 [Ixodes scapularis]|uniref:Uncharacterized protein n=1 Tax=Ixodes scapularis TaxID=6945 RepID=B7P6J9_IXOSC|nr:hypothetical protein IscW_ISCW000578 [Ixodes scapularis]|eukprot:XP_002408989.1 hypothetical protein IscW_ISCW000578 [Ixodes scapularis]